MPWMQDTEQPVARTFRLEPELYERLRARAFEERTTMNALVTRGLLLLLDDVPARHDLAPDEPWADKIATARNAREQGAKMRGGGSGPKAERPHRKNAGEVCICDHPPKDHLRVHHASAGSAYANCKRCPCKLYRARPL